MKIMSGSKEMSLSLWTSKSSKTKPDQKKIGINFLLLCFRSDTVSHLESDLFSAEIPYARNVKN